MLREQTFLFQSHNNMSQPKSIKCSKWSSTLPYQALWGPLVKSAREFPIVIITVIKIEFNLDGWRSFWSKAVAK